MRLLLIAIATCALCDAAIYGGDVPDRVLLSAPWTAFHEDGSLHPEMIAEQAAFAKKSLVNYVWVNGGMAQWAQLSFEERKTTAERWVQAGHENDLYIIIHVGSQNLTEARELALHAEKIGADAIALIPPFVPKLATLEEVVEASAAVAQVTKLPFFYYHIPGTTGYNFKMSEFLRLSSVSIPTLRGIKYVSNDYNDFYDCLHSPNGTYIMMYAPEPKITGCVYGAKHFVLAEAYFGPYVNAMAEAYDRGDHERALAAQRRRDDLADVMSGAEKYVMKMLGIDLGPPRAPDTPFPKSTYDRVEDNLRKWGFFFE